MQYCDAKIYEKHGTTTKRELKHVKLMILKSNNGKNDYICSGVSIQDTKKHLKRQGMRTEEIALSRLVENEDNPRTITNSQFQKLVQSIIVFPRMLSLRPIVVDETMTALGGNMRLRALRHLTTMDEAGIRLKLNAEGRLTEEQQTAIIDYWKEWQKQPTVPVVYADDLSEAQKDEFVAKDNISYGSWDYSELANNWDAGQLQGWGLPVWNDTSLQQSQATGKDSSGSKDKDETDALPPELDGVDLNPDELPAMEGDTDTPMENVVIKYRREDAEKVARLLGVDTLDRIIYNYNDLKKQEGGEE